MSRGRSYPDDPTIQFVGEPYKTRRSKQNKRAKCRYYREASFSAKAPIRTQPFSFPGGGELCLQPQIARTPHFSAVAFQAPNDDISVVVINVGDAHPLQWPDFDQLKEKEGTSDVRGYKLQVQVTMLNKPLTGVELVRLM